MVIPWIQRLGIRRLTLVAAGLCGLAGILLEYGTYPGPLTLRAARGLSGLAVGLFLFEQILAWREEGTFRRYLRRHWPTFFLSVLLLLEVLGLLLGGRTQWMQETLLRLHARSLAQVYLVILQVYLLAVFAVEIPHLHRRFASTRVRPALAFVLVFVALIVCGAGLLLLPRSTPPEEPLNALDALFTSTSAVCVTGLVVRDTGSGFTVFGQAVILVLIQLGGLGIMSLTAAVSLLLGRGIGVRESSLLREVFQVPLVSAVGRTIRGIILLTLALEAVGTGLLYRGLREAVPDPGARLFTALFHAVSAFCNAGFTTFNESLVGLADRPLVMGTVAALLIVGGLGFGVVAQAVAWLAGRLSRRAGHPPRLGLHARVVLGLSTTLLVGGTILLAALEWNGALAGQGFGAKLSQAFFQSATCRTAGFNSLDLTALSPAAIFLMITLMFIGGAPGSTAGGVKVTVLAVVWANLRSIGAGLGPVRLGGRELDPVHVQRAMLILSSGLVVTGSAVFLLLVIDGSPFLETVFEVVSALGTVGLSLGLTGALSPAGRLVIILVMFIGRLGPLTLANSLTGPGREPNVRLPRGRILIG